jgi:hypothetical protein
MSEPFSKEKIYIVEIDVPACSLVYGVGACTANRTGDAKCFNTLASCQVLGAYNEVKKTYRYCEQLSPHPVGLEAVPNLNSVSISPAQIQLDGGLGVRSNLSLSFNDHPSSDLDTDPYVLERSYDPYLRGTYWGKFRVRNQFYQNSPTRLISAYLSNGAVDLVNADTYHFVLETLDVSAGSASIIAKDPLKLADNKRSQAPVVSTGEIVTAINASATIINLKPSGVGNEEYPTEGIIRVSSEVMSFTRTADELTIVRGQFNTTAIGHSEGDKVQLCLQYLDRLDDILADLLVNYANINTNFIPYAFWTSEVNDNLSGLIQTLITEPIGVTKLIKELGEQFPHSLFWDERAQKIQLTAIKPPPEGANVYDENSNIISDSFNVADKRDLRVSTVFVYYGQINPTEKLDQANNYAGTYVRANLNSIARYGGNEIKTIFSRWINRDNKAQALRLAARIGRRFGTIPRAINFELDAKDKSVWAGQVIGVNHKYLPDFSGLPSTVLFQIITAQETDNFKYTGIEYIYDALLPQDEGGGDDGVITLIIEGDRTNYNIRDIYNTRGETPDATTVVRVLIEGSARVGSTSTSTFSLDTGLFPTGATIIIENRNLILGAGGQGADASGGNLNGGIAINLQHPITLNNLGIIGGGGSGGGANQAGSVTAGGGGGAGYLGGVRGIGDGGRVLEQSQNGTNLLGGAGEEREDPEDFQEATGQSGGDLGKDANGNNILSIQRNGNTITYTNQGDIRGTIS